MGALPRYNVNSADFNHLLDSYRQGVREMQQRSNDDPTSWIYQANIHGTVDEPAQDDWNMCQHQSYFFLPWHRMYIFWFERILRQASGNPNLTLPYWDYSDPNSRALPEAFRLPADSSNPLYVKERRNMPPFQVINEGSQLPVSVVSFSEAFNFHNFTSTTTNNVINDAIVANSFGGDVVPGPAQFADKAYPPDTFDGELELQPHNMVHVAVGGRYRDSNGWHYGLMYDPRTAARDPIFWLHHSNIDRLWAKWLADGIGSNPTVDNWLNTSFNFFDENGRKVTMFVRDVLDTTSFTYYIYPDTSQNPQVLPGYTYE
jgi:tyrosinase